MMTLAETQKITSVAQFRSKRLFSAGLLVTVVIYMIYIFFAFDVGGLAKRAKFENATTLAADSWSHKEHMTISRRNESITYTVEGERKARYPDGTQPDWVIGEPGALSANLGNGNSVEVLSIDALQVTVAEFGTINITVVDDLIETDLIHVPDWVSLSERRFVAVLDGSRVTITRKKTEIYRYFAGWELFFFTFDSPYRGRGFTEIFFGPRINPERNNFVGALDDFWYNSMWRHSDVAWALGETILMAFLGTVGAAMISLPLAFLAARRFAPLMAVRFAFRRIFDLFRGIDALIWSVILSRAFGPGPLTGALAILMTDIGTFGKTFSEALENVDDKQIEGIASTGAKTAQLYRFGVIPQVLPILLSQVLYLFESNTRSATIIGAITGGGIGLLITQAIHTQKDWEEITYYIILIILMVSFLDWLSGKIRGKLIVGS
jgi:phosphonate transport system permease protein